MSQAPANHTHARRMLSIILIATVGLLALAGCGGDDDQPPAGEPPVTTRTAPPPATTSATTITEPTTSEPAATRTVTLYFADAEAQKLVEESRRSSATGSPLRAALVELANGPASGSEGQPALPAGTQVVGTDVQDEVALVNLSEEFVTGYPSGGAAAEFAVLAPLVYTATAVDGIESVRITVQGQVPTPAGSQFDWGSAFRRTDFPDAVAAAP